jgi:hypothetical protein
LPKLSLPKLNTDSRSILLRAPAYVERSGTVAAILSLVGVVILAGGVLVGDVGGTILAAVGTTFLTVAILSIVYDAYLKDVLLGEIYSAMGVQDVVRAVDLEQIVRKDRLDLADFLQGATTITVVPLDPETWSHTDWRQVVDQAVRKSVRVVVLLPDHDSPHIDALAERLGIDHDQLIQQVSELPDKLAASWDVRGSALAHSTLEICLYGAISAVGVVATDNRILLEIPPALKHPAADRSTIAVTFGRGGWSPIVTELVDDQLSETRIPGFSRSVMRPLENEVSPDAPTVEGDRGPEGSDQAP